MKSVRAFRRNEFTKKVTRTRTIFENVKLKLKEMFKKIARIPRVKWTYAS